MTPRLDDDTFGSFRQLVRDAIGVRVRSSSRAEFERHLAERIAALHLADPAQYLAALRAGSPEELQDLIDAVVPCECVALRHERGPTTFLRGWLAERDAARVWCAGWGGGDEVETLRELAAEAGTALEIVASDVHAGLVAQAATGTDGARFVHHNLLDPAERLGTFDAVLLRHVLDAFDVATRARVLEHVRAVLEPDGVLVLGERESLLHVEHRFRYLHPSVFVRTLAGTRARS